MRVLVTGGAGFVGSYVVRRLLDAGADVIVFDSLSPEVHPSRPDLDPRAELIEAPLDDAIALDRAVLGVDAVSHQAARVGLGVDFDDVERYVHDNDAGTAALLRALWRSGFAGRLIVASSMVVYGEGRYRCATHGPIRPGPRRREDLEAGRFEPACGRCGEGLLPEPIDEGAPLDPRNVYAATKVHTEHLAACFGRETRTQVGALRYHNVYGPGMPRDTPYAGVASIFRSALEVTAPPQVYEDGQQRRDFVHVDDVARANVLALDQEWEGPLNVASGRPRSVLQMAQSLARAFGATAPAPIVTGRFRVGDVRHVFASPRRAEEVLGFTAEHDFDEGMTEFASAPLRGG